MTQGVDNRLSTGIHTKFGIDVIEVEVDGARAERELLGDLFVAQALGQQSEDLHLAGRQLNRRFEGKTDRKFKTAIGTGVGLDAAAQLLDPLTGRVQRSLCRLSSCHCRIC